MMKAPGLKFTTKVFTVDSFLFQRRKFFRQGFEWSWDYCCDQHILADLRFEVEKNHDDTIALLIEAFTSTDKINSAIVSWSWPPCARGIRSVAAVAN